MSQAREVLPPEEFAGRMGEEVDTWFETSAMKNLWLIDLKDLSPHAVQDAIMRRLMAGYLNEIYIRDAIMLLVKRAPDLRSQSVLLRQVEDEHKHAVWLHGLLSQRGVDTSRLRMSRAWSMYWTHVQGRALDPQNFLSVVATTQLVSERVGGLRATTYFAEQIADIDPDVHHLYADKIRPDEVFHTVDLPQAILERHATTLEAQDMVRDGIERAKVFVRLRAEEMLGRPLPLLDDAPGDR